MTQLNFTINSDKFLEEVLQSDLNTATKGIITALLNQVMEAERDSYIQASAYERTGNRQDYRNGYYERDYTIKAGTITLRVPRTRSGEFSTDIFQKYQRMDQALVMSMVEMVINGVSTRKVTNIVEELIGDSVSKSYVSKAVEKIEPEIQNFCGRSLTHATFEYLFLDAMYIKVNENHHSVQKAVYIAQGVREDGFREIIGFMVADVESTKTWTEFLQNLKARGLTTPKMVISDGHQGIKAAVKTEFMGTKWQRCVVHFLRNIISKMPRKNSKQERDTLKRIFKATTKQHAIEYRDTFFELVKDNAKYDAAVKTLDEGFFDAIQYTSEPHIAQKYLRSTNSVERINREIRRRERVISFFPNVRSAERLIGAVLLDIHERLQAAPYKLYDKDNTNE